MRKNEIFSTNVSPQKSSAVKKLEYDRSTSRSIGYTKREPIRPIAAEKNSFKKVRLRKSRAGKNEINLTSFVRMGLAPLTWKFWHSENKQLLWTECPHYGKLFLVAYRKVPSRKQSYHILHFDTPDCHILFSHRHRRCWIILHDSQKTLSKSPKKRPN